MVWICQPMSTGTIPPNTTDILSVDANKQLQSLCSCLFLKCSYQWQSYNNQTTCPIPRLQFFYPFYFSYYLTFAVSFCPLCTFRSTSLFYCSQTARLRDKKSNYGLPPHPRSSSRYGIRPESVMFGKIAQNLVEGILDVLRKISRPPRRTFLLHKAFSSPRLL